MKGSSNLRPVSRKCVRVVRMDVHASCGVYVCVRAHLISVITYAMSRMSLRRYVIDMEKSLLDLLITSSLWLLRVLR